MRQLDIGKIHGFVKSCIYQFLKPEERVLFRPPSYGGLGVHNVKLKAQAALTRSFLETACHPQFIQSLFHSNLFRYHVLNDQSVPDPGFPPFYPEDFFAKIREVHIETPLNVSTMTQKQWYHLLLEDTCTMQVVEGGQMQYISTTVDWTGPGCLQDYRVWDQSIQSSCSNFSGRHRILRKDFTGPKVKPVLFARLLGVLVQL